MTACSEETAYQMTKLLLCESLPRCSRSARPRRRRKAIDARRRRLERHARPAASRRRALSTGEAGTPVTDRPTGMGA